MTVGVSKGTWVTNKNKKKKIKYPHTNLKIGLVLFFFYPWNKWDTIHCYCIFSSILPCVQLLGHPKGRPLQECPCLRRCCRLSSSGFYLNMAGIVVNMTGFVLNMTGLVLNMTRFFQNITGCVLYMTGFFLNMTIFVKFD